MFTPKSVDSIMKGFTKTISNLRAVAAEQIDAANIKSDQIMRLEEEVDNHDLEANRAYMIANRIETLMGVDHAIHQTEAEERQV
jgi:hypothetical protein